MMRSTIILTSVLVALVATAAAQTVRLRADARVTGGEVRLADVAVLADLPAGARELVVFHLGSDRHGGEVDLAGIQQALRRAGINPVPIRFCGAARCILRRGRTRPTPPQPMVAPAPAAPAAPTAPHVPTLAERIVAELTASLEVEPEALTVTFRDNLEAVLAQRPSGEVTLVSNDRRRLGRRRWLVEFATAAGGRRRCHIHADVSLAREVVMAARILPSGTIIGPDDIRVSTLDDDGAEAWMTDRGLVIGQQVRRAIPAGRAVAATDLERPVLIKRGQTIDVRCGPVSLKAIAMDNGRQGEWIDVKNPRSDRLFRALVTGPAEATVAPAGAAGEATP